MKTRIIDLNAKTETEVDFTAEEITAREQEQQAEETRLAQKEADKQAKEDLKASAKAKLVAGEALTQEEADTIVL